MPADPPPAPDLTALWRWIGEADAYLDETLAERDSVIIRWPERTVPPLRVFFEPGDHAGVTPPMIRAVEDAFRRWERVPEIPLDFVFVREGDGAEVRVRWIRAFEVQRAGQADVTWRTDGLIQYGTLTLATETVRGVGLPADAVFTVALHEIGHLLGLGHSDDPSDVMAPSTAVHDLTARDRRTATMLYSLPPGPLNGSSH